MRNLLQDIRYAFRTLRKTPAFTLAALLTLTLGIGANSAVFSVINAVLLQPLPFPNSGQLLNMSQADPATPGLSSIEMSLTKFRAIHEQSHSFESVAAYYALTVSLISGREPEVIPAARVSLDLFHTLGIGPALGRSFLEEEDQSGSRDVAVISDGFWHSHFGGDPSLIGKNLTLDGKSVTVVGILPASFHFPMQFPEPQIWLPRIFETNFLNQQQINSGSGYLTAIGRLRPGTNLADVQAELDTINSN